MDINPRINAQTLLGVNRLAENALDLKVGQQLDVKVTGAAILAAKNAITLTLGNKDITVQSSQPITLSPGQDLKIQVTQIAPVTEFKLLNPPTELKNQALQLQDPKTQTTELRLKLISTARDGGSVAIGREPMRPAVRDDGSVAIGREPMRPAARDGRSIATGRDAGNIAPGREPIQPTTSEKQAGTTPSSPVTQALDAKIISIAGNKIQLQIFIPAQATAGTDNKQAALINIERTQLTNAPSDLKVGQNLNLEIIKTGAAPEFKIIPAANHIPEAKVAEFIKQFLPRHEASPILLNQLIKDLPQLMKNPSVPQSLKDIAAKIIQNLPPKEQLISSPGLKLAIANSGLFLEAKLPPAMAQAELIHELPQLIKNESVPQSLQRIAAEILQNLTQKEPLPNSPVPEQPAANSKPAAEAEAASAKLNPTDLKDSAAKAETLGNKVMQGAVAEDFKANLLKFIQALKQELHQQGEQQLNQVDLDLFKNLQHKTENTVAKIVLDQLMSLPKEDSPKQLWIIDIPFLDRQQAEAVRIEVQRDKENKQQSGGSNWSVNITITPPELGTIHCVVSYRNDMINTYFKSQHTQTTELIKHNLDYLKNQLEESGLKTGHMDAHDGVQKAQAPHSQQLAGKKLFDENA